MLIFNHEALKNGTAKAAEKAQANHVLNQWSVFNQMERGFTAQNQAQAAIANAAAYIPRDVYQEFENQSTQILRESNLTLMQDLMPLAKALPLGKVEHIYRKVSDSGVVSTDLDMSTPDTLDKSTYDYASTIKVFHHTAFGRGWMEMEGQRSEGFDGLIDDQANATRATLESIAGHFYNGIDKTFNGTAATGIKNSSAVHAVDLDATDLNIDFTSSAASAADIRTAWVAMIYKLRTDNNVNADLTFYISAEIEQNFQRIYDSTGGMADKTIMQAMLDLAGVKEIKTDRSLSGNEVVYGALQSQFIRPLVGMAVTTVPIFRANPFDSYNFKTWANVGLEIKTDFSGKTGWAYAREIA